MRRFLTFLAVTLVGTVVLGFALEATIGRERSDDYSNFRVAALVSALAGVVVARGLSQHRRGGEALPPGSSSTPWTKD